MGITTRRAPIHANRRAAVRAFAGGERGYQ